MPQWFASLTSSQWWASSRHYITFFFGLLGGIGLISVTQQQGAIDAVEHISTGIKELATGIGALLTIFVPIVNGYIASRKASPAEQIKSVAAMANDPAQPATSEAKVVLVNAAASLPEVEKVVAPALAPIPATAPNVVSH